MFVIRVREYSIADGNPNVFDKKIEVTTESRAANFAAFEPRWIYMFVELKAPEVL